MKLIFLGAPGAGKGTQAEKVSNKYSIPTVSTGVIIRESIKNQTAMGKKAAEYTDRGELVPDEVVIAIIKDKLSEMTDGFILDGFPRTVAQAEALDKMGIELDTVVNIEVSDDMITKRMSGRRVCPACGNSYHIEYKPAKDGAHCDACGAELVVRKDDMPEVVTKRLEVYHEQTEPLIEYYEKKGKLVTVIGQIEVEDTTALTFSAIEKALGAGGR